MKARVRDRVLAPRRFEARSRVTTSDVAAVVEQTRDKMVAYLRRREMLAVDDAEKDHEMTPLAVSAVAGTRVGS